MCAIGPLRFRYPDFGVPGYCSAKQIEYCIDCQECNNANDYPSGCHVHRDLMDTLMAKQISCHGLILASPVYFCGVTAQMKTFKITPNRCCVMNLILADPPCVTKWPWH